MATKSPRYSIYMFQEHYRQNVDSQNSAKKSGKCKPNTATGTIKYIQNKPAINTKCEIEDIEGPKVFFQLLSTVNLYI
jgi:hypothetical protein